MGSNPWVVSILKEGYTLPFKQRPILTRFPVVQSGYANPDKNMYLKEALVSLMRKLVVAKVVVKSSLAFYNRLFLVPKPNGKWRPILDLSQLNLFLSTGTFKMETQETIRLSLKTGKWVTSLDFSDAYFHIPIAPRLRKYLRLFLFHQTFQFTALPFGLATVHQGSQRGETDGSGKGYQDPPVPRLVTESPFPGKLPTTYPDPLGPVSAVRVDCKHDQIRVSSQTGLQFCRLPVRPDHWSGTTHSGPFASPSREVEIHKEPSQVYGLSVHVSDRPLDGHREAGLSRSTSSETHTMASQEKTGMFQKSWKRLFRSFSHYTLIWTGGWTKTIC